MTDDTTVARAMRESDLASVTAIEAVSFSDPWPPAAFQECLGVDNRVNLVLADKSGQVVAYLCAQCVADEIQIHNIAVAEAARRQGWGTLLLRAVEDEGLARGAACAILDVRVTNTAALALYERLGYRPIGRRRGYYRQPVCDALILFKPLVPPNPSVHRQETNDGVVP